MFPDGRRSIEGVDRVRVFYDDGCGFCRWSASKVARWDHRRRLRFSPIRSEEGDARLGQMDAVQRDGSWHVITRDGRVASAGAAVPILLRELPGGGPLARVTQTFPRTTDRFYRAVARRRGTFGKILHTDACRVPTR
jgi:predicted DCC family thiol-disulfide oxidoreductase YuxK